MYLASNSDGDRSGCSLVHKGIGALTRRFGMGIIIPVTLQKDKGSEGRAPEGVHI